jgi:hypothetical protein|tara:strand:+ start:4421 stop:4756 length:336 start_codon:yes stop_codon:yes gene_type:complete
MENENKFTATGALFTAKSKRTENSPDYSGSMEFEMDVVDDLIAQKNEGISQPKVNLVGWKKVAKTGLPYLRIISNVEKARLDAKEEIAEKRKADIEKNNASDDKLDDEIPF